LIVADNVTSETMSIYDLDDPAMPLWMQFNSGGTHPTQYTLGQDSWGTITSLFALNGRIYIGRTAAGFVTVDFANDYGERDSTDGHHRYVNIANRNASSEDIVLFGGSYYIPNGTINDIAATVLEGAEIGALGLPIPTVAVATASGISWIHPNGDVYDSTAYGAVNELTTFGRDEWVGANTAATEVVRIYKTAFADGHLEDAGREYLATGIPAILDGDPVLASTSKGVAVGTPDGLSLVKDNPAKSTDSAVAYITSAYNTGYMVGDIRFAGLAGNGTADEEREDRSVKGNDLAETGTIDSAAVATGAELYAYSGFTASDYLSRAYDADFDFGTGDFSVMVWFKTTDGSGTQHMVDRSASTAVQRWSIQMNSSGQVRIYISDGTNSDATAATQLWNDGNWHLAVGVKRGTSSLEMYIDGKLTSADTSLAATSTLSDGDAVLKVGVRAAVEEDEFTGSLSLLRISATAPTPQQIKEIYEAEKPLFAANAKCLLQGDNATVQGLAYDKSTGILQATQAASTTNASATMFRGLEVADTFLGNAHDSSWTYNSATLLAANGGVSAYYRSGGSLLCDLPAIDVRSALNEDATKLPDDGKLHFSGVTTDATPTVIGQIPISENESVVIRAKMWGKRYNYTTSSWWLLGEIVQNYYRDIGGNVIEPSETPTMSLIDEGSAALDFTLEESTASQTMQLKVTGGATRIEWTASVEVQRISDKTYER
jgi:hypothetical protein